jgi:GT2 family glycosyltransferase
VRFVVPAYRPGRDLASCLDAIRSSDHGGCPVLVAFDGPPLEAERRVCERYGADVYIAPGVRGPGPTRNSGVGATTEELLFFLDADVQIMPSGPSRALATLREQDAAAVVGTYTPLTTARGRLTRLKNLQHSWAHRSNSGPVASLWAGCALVRRDAFVDVGGFDETLRYCEDIELGARLTRRGFRVIFDPGVEAMHLKRYTMRSWMRNEVVERAAPWTSLLLSGRASPGVLNTGVAGQAGFAAAVLTAFRFGVARSWPARARALAFGTAAVAAVEPGLIKFTFESAPLSSAVLMAPYLLAHHVLGAGGAALAIADHVRSRLTV